MNERDFPIPNLSRFEQAEMFALLMLAESTLECVMGVDEVTFAECEETIKRIKAFARQMEVKQIATEVFGAEEEAE
jgi:hypothetical protein